MSAIEDAAGSAASVPDPREWIGPIACDADVAEPLWHDPGTAAATRPVFGGYLPCRAPDGGWEADGSTTTRLQFFEGAWYVQRPDGGARCRRAVVIAVDALRAGAPIPNGVSDEEAAKAREIHGGGGAAWRWASNDLGRASVGETDVWRAAPERPPLSW